MAYETIKLFEALSPSEFPALSRLEIKDNTRNTLRHYWDPADNKQGWERPRWTYLGLVPSFLASVSTGCLPNLKSLWLDEKALIPLGFAVQNFCDVDTSPSEEPRLDPVLWRETFGTTFQQLESLRVGFGPITHLDAGRILGLCDPTKLTQFGFE
jgi:hypothetical protein